MLLGSEVTFKSNLTLPVSSIGDASNGDASPAGSVINCERLIKPITVGASPKVNSYTCPSSASSTSAGVEPPQQSHAGQLGFGVPSKIVRFCGIPVDGGVGIGAAPSTSASSSES